MKTINTTLKSAVAALFASVPVPVQAGFAKSAVPSGAATPKKSYRMEVGEQQP